MNIALFSRQIQTLLTAGISLIQALEILTKNHSKKTKPILLSIQEDLKAGLTFAEALQKHPQFFNKLFCNLVAIGEHSGTLTSMMGHINKHHEFVGEIKQKFKKALTYPCAVLFIASLITISLLLWVIPQFESLFANFNAQLPAPTRFIIFLSNWLILNWSLLIIFTVILIYGFQYANRYPTFRYWKDKILLKLPGVQILYHHAIFSRFTNTLKITYAAGLPLVEGLQSSSSIVMNLVYTQAIHDMSRAISHGHSLQFAMKNSNLFPLLMLQMIEIGENSGTLEVMLDKLSEYYRNKLTSNIETLSHLFEPIIMALLGLIIGGIILAMYLPLISLGTIV